MDAYDWISGYFSPWQLLLPLVLWCFFIGYLNYEEMVSNEKSMRMAMGRQFGELQNATYKNQTNLREKDRIIQTQREEIARLEHRAAASESELNWQRFIVEVKDKAILDRSSTIKELKGKLVENHYHARNLQWDIESYQAQVEEKDDLLWVTTGRGSAAILTIEDLQKRLNHTIQVLNLVKMSDNHAIDYLEAKYAKAIRQLQEKLQDAEQRAQQVQQDTADAKKYRANISESAAHLMQCVRLRDVALRDTQEKLKASEAKLKASADEKMHYYPQALLEHSRRDVAARDIQIAELKLKIDNASETSKKDRNTLAANLVKANDDNDTVVHNLARRNQALLRLTKRDEANKNFAASERKDLQDKIATLKNELIDCKTRLATVNTTILDQEAQLANSLEEKKKLEGKLVATVQLAEYNGSHLAFAQHALDNAITQLKELNTEYNTLNLASQTRSAEAAATETFLASAREDLQAQKDQTTRYAHQLLKTEERYKSATCTNADLQARLHSSFAQANSTQAELATLRTLAADLQAKHDGAKNAAAAVKSERDACEALVSHLHRKLSASISHSTQTSKDLAAAQAEKSDLTKNLDTAQSDIARLETRVEESDERYNFSLGRVRAANEKANCAVLKCGQAVRLARGLRERNLGLRKALVEEGRARELVDEGYVEVEAGVGGEVGGQVGGEVGDGEERGRDGYFRGRNTIAGESADDGEREGDSSDDDEEEEEAAFETVDVVQGREPVEGEEGFEFVDV